MSVLGPGKISGHSGTAQRHRKAFKDARALQKKKARIFSGQVQQNLGHDQKWEGRNADHRKNTVIRLIVISIGVLCLLATVLLIYNASDFSTYQTELMEQEDVRQDREMEEAYRLLLNSGENYLRANSFLAAEEEFALALKLYPQGEKALRGMTQTLARKCLYLEIDCQLTKDYQLQTGLLMEEN